MSRRTIHLVSLGCVKNRVDSEVMLGIAGDSGFEIVDDASSAEVIVINTCGFIGEAKKESIDTIFEMVAHKEAGTCEKLVVAGCLSQRHPKELADEIPEVDHFLGSSDMRKLEKVLEGDAARMLVGNPADWVIQASDPRRISTGGASAYVKIGEGCNRTCSFCVIPDLRGKMRSRQPDDIVREVENLAAQGILEVNLVSQDTIAYGRDLPKESRADLATLLERVADIPGIRWVRLLYLYPESITDKLIELFAEHPRVVPYVDMPLQHAADGMLRRMRRGHGGERLRRLVERMRGEIPDLTFRTAFIVGHPGETEAEFQELCDFVEWARFEHVVAFRYSDEEGSISRDLEGKVPAKIAEARHRKLMRIQRRIAGELNEAMIGRELEVLVEGTSDEHEYVMMGRHRGQAPEIDGQVYLSGGEAFPGTMRRVVIEQAADYDLVGELIDEASMEEGRGQPAKARVSLKVVGDGWR